MFTGIVEELGTIAAIESLPDAARLTVCAAAVLADVSAGDSLAVDGCCLTVVHSDGSVFTADVMAETLRRTTIGARVAGDSVNLERAMAAGGRFGGHVVQGHVDATGTVGGRESSEHWDVVRIVVPASHAAYVVPKGSVAVDGVSLTVVDVGDDWFTVSLIPETLRRTTLGTRRTGDAVNLEFDVLAKYIERMLATRGLLTTADAGGAA
jgi:riboflavin synthase